MAGAGSGEVEISHGASAAEQLFDPERTVGDWLVQREVEEVMMESTALYWRPVWKARELHWRPKRRAREGATLPSGTVHRAHGSRIAVPVAG
jgi:hypothetical protein